jgi:CheY-like chemotaxis protein
MPLRIMVVDDEPAALRAIKAAVEPLGLEVLLLQDGRLALERLKAERFDGFMVEGAMPGVDGFELTQAIRSSTSSATAPIVMITDALDVGTMRRAFQAGISIFLTKPVSPERLAGLVKILRGPMLIEKRRRSRLPLRTPVKVRTDAHVYRGVSINIGEGGLLAEVSAEIGLGQPVEVEFNLPGVREALKLSGAVLRRDASGRIALHFTRLSDADLAAIRQYIIGNLKD